MSIEIVTEVLAIVAALISLAGFARDIRKEWTVITINFIKSASKIIITLGVDLLFVLVWLGMNRLLDHMVLRLFPMDSPSIPITVLMRVFETSTFLVVLMFIITDIIRLIRYVFHHDSPVDSVSK